MKMIKAVLLCVGIGFCIAADGAEKVWSGGGGNFNFSTAGNWSPSGAPIDGDTLKFANTAALEVVNDLVDFSCGGISVEGSGSVSFGGGGNGFALSGNINISGSKELRLYVPVTIDDDITLNLINDSLYTHADVTGTGSITIEGSKYLNAREGFALAGGITVNGGRISVQKPTFTTSVLLNMRYVSSSDYVQLSFDGSGTYNFPIRLSGNQGSGSTLHAGYGTEVICKGLITLAPDAYTRWVPSGVFSIAGGIVIEAPTTRGASIIFNGNIRIIDEPIDILNDLYFDQGTMRLGVAGNKYNRLICFAKTMYTDVAYALDPSSQVVMGTSYSKKGELDLSGNDQVIDRLAIGNWSDAEISDYSVTSSGGGAVLRCQASASTVFYGSINGGVTLVWAPQSDSYSMSLTGRVSETSGELQVEAGTLVLAADTAFPDLSGLSASGSGVMRIESAEITDGVELVVSDSGMLSIADGVELVCLTAMLDGSVLEPGFYDSASIVGGRSFISGGGTLHVLSVALSGTVCSWTGGGADENFSTADNWDVEPVFDGSETLVFGGAGSTAVVDGNYFAGALRFVRDTTFVLEAADSSSTLKVGVGGIVVLPETSETVVAHEIAVPIEIAQVCGIEVATNNVLSITGVVSGGTPTAPLTKSGWGTLSMTATNTFENPLLIDAGFVEVNNGTALGNPTGTITINYNTNTDNNWNKRGAIYFTDMVVTNERAITMSSAGLFLGQVYPWSGTVVLNGKLTFEGSGGRIDNSGTMILRGGYECFGGSSWLQVLENREIRIEGEPLNLGTRSFTVDNKGTLRICTKNNSWGYVSMNSGTLLCGAEGCLPENTHVNFGAGYTGTGYLDLDGFDQQVKYLTYIDSVYTPDRVVRSATPATLTLKGDAAGWGREFVGSFKGKASLVHHNTGTLTLKTAYSASTSEGDLIIRAGTVKFDDGAIWIGSTNITVEAEGTLAVESTAGATFGGSSREVNRTQLNLVTGGLVHLAEGVVEYVDAATVDGKYLQPGTYGSASSGAAYKSGLFSGTGILHVMRSYELGTLLLVR